MNNLEALEELLILVSPLIHEISETSERINIEKIGSNITKIIYYVNISQEDQEFNAIIKAKELFSHGGIPFMKITYIGLVWASYRLSSKTQNCAFQVKVFDYVFELIGEIVQEIPEECIKLLMNGALQIDRCGIQTEDAERLITQYVEKAFELYENELIDSDIKYKVLTIIIGTLEQINILSSNCFSELTKRIIKNCTKLLRKQEQCKIILSCSHIFISPTRVKLRYKHRCLQRILKNVWIDLIILVKYAEWQRIEVLIY